MNKWRFLLSRDIERECWVQVSTVRVTVDSDSFSLFQRIFFSSKLIVDRSSGSQARKYRAQCMLVILDSIWNWVLIHKPNEVFNACSICLHLVHKSAQKHFLHCVEHKVEPLVVYFHV